MLDKIEEVRIYVKNGQKINRIRLKLFGSKKGFEALKYSKTRIGSSIREIGFFIKRYLIEENINSFR